MTDPQAFEQLVIRHQGVVCAVAYAVLRDRARSEEIAQEAFLIAWQKLPAMTTPPVMPGWVCGIARNLAANAARRRKESAMVDTHEPAALHTPLDSVLDAERIDLANRALARLDDRDREAIVLYYFGDESNAAVAATLGITEPAARQRLHRGRERLASALTSVEATLRATRPGPAFTAACVAAIAAASSGDAAAATTSVAKSKRWIPIAGAAAVVAGITTAVVVTRDPGSSSSPPPRSAPIAGAGSSSTTPDAALRSRPSGVVIKYLDAPSRAKSIDKIRDARVNIAVADRTKVYDFAGDNLATPIQMPMPASKSTSQNLDKAKMRWAIRDIQPLLLECYNARPAGATKGGTLEVRMSIVGEPDVGSIVETVELGGAPHLTGDRDFAECVRETLLSIELPPMPSPNETWSVNYPLLMP